MSKKEYVCFLLLFPILILFYSCSYSSRAARSQLEKSGTKVYDVVVVPGIPLIDGKWNMTMKRRIYWAKFLYDKGLTKNIIFSGSAV